MDFYDKYLDRFQDPSKVKNSAAIQKKMFRGICCCHIDYVLVESSILQDMVSQSSLIDFSEASINF